MKHDNRSFACCFYLKFWHDRQTKRSKGVCTRLTDGKEVCRSFGRRIHVARYRNYRLVLSLRSRYRQKTQTAHHRKIIGVWYYRRKNTAIICFFRLRKSRYRQNTKNRLPPKNYRQILVIPPPQKLLPPKNENRLLPKLFRRMALPPRLCPPKKALPTIGNFIFREGRCILW